MSHNMRIYSISGEKKGNIRIQYPVTIQSEDSALVSINPIINMVQVYPQSNPVQSNSKMMCKPYVPSVTPRW